MQRNVLKNMFSSSENYSRKNFLKCKLLAPADRENARLDYLPLEFGKWSIKISEWIHSEIFFWNAKLRFVRYFCKNEKSWIKYYDNLWIGRQRRRLHCSWFEKNSVRKKSHKNFYLLQKLTKLNCLRTPLYIYAINVFQVCFRYKEWNPKGENK